MKKIIVVGAGILGASTAYHLSKKNVEVIIVDRKDKGQATDAAAGIVCPWLSQRRNQAWYQLAKAGARFYPELIEDLKKHGETETGYAKVGALSLHKDKEKLIKLKERAIKRKPDAPEIGDILELNKEETQANFPPLDEEFESVQVSGAARVDGRALRDALLRSAQQNGAKLVYGDATLLSNENKVIGVIVGNKTLLADNVVICAGAWANQLLKPLGIHFQVRFQKAQIVHLELPDTNTNDWPVLIPPGKQYLLAFENGRIVAGATHEDIEEFDTRITAGGLQEVINTAIDIAPGLNETTFLEARTGFRPFTPGFLPVIGPLPEWDGIVIANGLGASGLTMGPYIGSELAKLAVDEEMEMDINLYSVEGALSE
ncbi:NAD(P)/FAD-dependent oxidoreductase [Mesobacillus maritimus]|uniref:FAD-binding oxidoreductase n=1 Tax=Mesobacillus maritimus TaxID=1643336 RepID=A0ABS7K0F7_9BACI|nr:FAD-dependent oxidoreductase [Mesobacillus maritimus]MBY0095641.1 FAD-binding oxidoreductase [Mesobacillus maritimus]